MGHMIKVLRARLDEIAIDRIKFGFNEWTTETQSENMKRPNMHSFVRGEQVIGRENDKKAFKELLFDSNMNENVSIIPIVGIGGQGKTTLAQYVYKEEKVNRHFDMRLWACVYDPFDVKIIIAKLIEFATTERPKSLEMDQLLCQLQVEIDGKRYLHILDDVWIENHEKNEYGGIERNANGDIFICEMHELIHDLAKSIAREECIISNPDATRVVERTRHVAFDSLKSLSNIPASLLKADRMRTLPPRFRTGPSHKSFNLISSFKYFRALSFSHIQEVPNSIGKLKHLRFLDLSWNEDIKLLPASITTLHNLQTLRLDFCIAFEELLEDTRNLINLRHLVLYAA
ncbi:putative disease resistance protein RGA4 [Corylus avellana]|uniref:putative disease resistance protein RGA4 n=1 Tax=Corylus avellana TaxID=13451 RepID=UPI00286A38EA|nr:putative disease resistance protein RGA4 [Corylus avellana]